MIAEATQLSVFFLPRALSRHKTRAIKNLEGNLSSDKDLF